MVKAKSWSHLWFITRTPTFSCCLAYLDQEKDRRFDYVSGLHVPIAKCLLFRLSKRRGCSTLDDRTHWERFSSCTRFSHTLCPRLFSHRFYLPLRVKFAPNAAAYFPVFWTNRPRKWQLRLRTKNVNGHAKLVIAVKTSNCWPFPTCFVTLWLN